jgi:starch synthase
MEKLRILFATMEIDPFLKLSDAATFIRQLPQGLQERGHEIRILMPKFGVINERRNRLHEVVRLSGINIRVGNEEKPLTIKVATINNTRLQVYFLDNEDYFQRKSALVDQNEQFHPDNDERAIFFCKGVIRTVDKLGWTPHIIHCHGWMTSLIPLYMKAICAENPVYKNTKVVYTLYNDQNNHPLSTNFAEKAGLEGMTTLNEKLKAQSAQTYSDFSMCGMNAADVVTKGQPTLQTTIEERIRANNLDVQYDFNGEDTKSYIEYYNTLYNAIVN